MDRSQTLRESIERGQSVGYIVYADESRVAFQPFPARIAGQSPAERKVGEDLVRRVLRNIGFADLYSLLVTAGSEQEPEVVHDQRNIAQMSNSPKQRVGGLHLAQL